MEIKPNGLAVTFETAGLNQQVVFTPDDVESLRALNNHPGWAVYKRTLAISKQGYQMALMASEDPNRLLKITGQIVGLNFAEVQLGLLMKQFEAKRVAEESKNRPQP